MASAMKMNERNSQCRSPSSVNRASPVTGISEKHAAQSSCSECGGPHGYRRERDKCPTKIEAFRLVDRRPLIEVLDDEWTFLDSAEDWYEVLGVTIDGQERVSEVACNLIQDLINFWEDEQPARSGPKSAPSPIQLARRTKLLFWPALSGERPAIDDRTIWRAIDVDTGNKVARSRDRAEVIKVADEWANR